MLMEKFSRTLGAFLAVAAVLSMAETSGPSVWAASREKTLYSFNPRGASGFYPGGGLIFDANGNLYGTAGNGGTYGYGTVFRLTPGSGDTWAETVLHSFCSASGCTDGSYPSASLIFDAEGNLYGTTAEGGANSLGTVFKLTPGAGGGWNERVLYSFCSTNGCTDGSYPSASLIFDAAGNLYGTTDKGGTYDLGTAFELISGAGGTWTESVLHSFNHDGKDGYYPDYSNLILDVAGNLYGMTEWGGAHNLGTAFELSPVTKGQWQEKVLHSFGDSYASRDGIFPQASLILDGAGNLYGTTTEGGAYNLGVVFKLVPVRRGNWKEEVLTSFSANAGKGAGPFNALTFDSAGNLYGTTVSGGAFGGYGTVFRLSNSGGKWKEKVLHSFGGGTDGVTPWTDLIFDAAGNLYGTTTRGGIYGVGTVFEVKP